MIINDPPNTLKIDSVWLFISQDADGNEGLVAATLGQLFTPLIAADKERLDQLRSIALESSKLTKKKIKLIRLTAREEIEVIGHDIN